MFSQNNSGYKKGSTHKTAVTDIVDLLVEFDLLASEDDYNVIMALLQRHPDRYNLKLALISLHRTELLSRRVFDQIIRDPDPVQTSSTLINQSIHPENVRYMNQIIQLLTDSNLLNSEEIFTWATHVIKQHPKPQDLYHVLITMSPNGLALYFKDILVAEDPQKTINDIQHHINEIAHGINTTKQESRPSSVVEDKLEKVLLTRAIDDNDLLKIIEARLKGLPEHAITRKNNLKSPVIQEFVSQHKLTIDEAENLSLIQRKNLESPTIRSLITSNQLLFKQAISLSADERKAYENRCPK